MVRNKEAIMTMDLARLLSASAPAGAEWAGLRRQRTRERSFSARDGKYDSARLSEDEGYMAEVLVDGCFGYAATGRADIASLKEAFGRAFLLAKASAGARLHRFDPSARPASTISWESPRLRRSELSTDGLAGLACSLSSLMKVDAKVIQTSVELGTRVIETEIASTSGASLTQTLHLALQNLQAIAREGNVVQKRSCNGSGRVLQGGAELFDAGALELDARRAAEEAIELLSAEDCPSMKGDLVLAPDQMILQIHESVGHPCELDRILGDERNFAGSTFVKPSDIGNLQYGSPLMNITFDPTVEGEAASYAFDDIGNPARREYIIKDGILVRALGSLESQARSGKPGVADQRSDSWSRAPIDRMANLNLEPGKDSFEEMVAGIERGVYMVTNRSWSIDDFRNKFQFGCEYAKLIEDGRVTRTLRNPNYRGVSSTFWRNLWKVGDPGTRGLFGAPNCGKGEPNQIIFVGHASPVCAFRGVEIFGGEA
jgi:predicted Zn-dependent protease